MDNYTKACRYAYKLDFTNYRDLVHDAFVSFWNTKQKNLFLEHEGFVMRVVKHKWYDALRRGNYLINTKLGRNVVYTDVKPNHKVTNITPEDILIAKDLKNRLDRFANSLPDMSGNRNSPPETLRYIVKKKIEGYENHEIAEELGVSRNSIHHHLKKVNFKQFEHG